MRKALAVIGSFVLVAALIGISYSFLNPKTLQAQDDKPKLDKRVAELEKKIEKVVKILETQMIDFDRRLKSLQLQSDDIDSRVGVIEGPEKRKQNLLNNPGNYIELVSVKVANTGIVNNYAECKGLTLENKTEFDVCWIEIMATYYDNKGEPIGAKRFSLGTKGVRDFKLALLPKKSKKKIAEYLEESKISGKAKSVGIKILAVEIVDK